MGPLNSSTHLMLNHREQEAPQTESELAWALPRPHFPRNSRERRESPGPHGRKAALMTSSREVFYTIEILHSLVGLETAGDGNWGVQAKTLKLFQSLQKGCMGETEKQA